MANIVISFKPPKEINSPEIINMPDPRLPLVNLGLTFS